MKLHITPAVNVISILEHGLLLSKAKPKRRASGACIYLGDPIYIIERTLFLSRYHSRRNMAYFWIDVDSSRLCQRGAYYECYSDVPPSLCNYITTRNVANLSDLSLEIATGAHSASVRSLI